MKEQLKAIARNPWVQRGVLAATFFTAADSAACAPSARPAEVRPTGAVPTQIRETPKPVQPTPTKEVPLTIDQQAKEMALQTWFQMLSLPQKKEDLMYGDKVFLNIDVVNKDRWETSMKELVKTNVNTAKEPLRIQWLKGYLKNHPWDPLVNGFKHVGEMEIDKMRIQSVGSRPLTEADRANGLSWDGTVSMGFISRHRVNYYAPTDWGKNEEMVRNWLASRGTDPLPQFSSWKDEGWSIKLRLRNGRWERDSTVTRGSFEVPVAVLGADSCLFVDACQRFDISMSNILEK